MWEKHLVARLSPKASQVLLSFLLARQVEMVRPLAEFANRTGLTRRSISEAIHELEDVGLVQIIHEPGQPVKVHLVTEMEEYYGHTKVYEEGAEEESTKVLLGGSQTFLPTPTNLEAVGGGHGGDARPGAGELITLCRKADESGDQTQKVIALQNVWSVAFPVKDYPAQRLQDSAARRWLTKWSAEALAEIILEAVERAKGRIEYPRAYIEKAMQTEETHRLTKEGKGAGGEPGEGYEIDDSLRRLVQLGREQFGVHED